MVLGVLHAVYIAVSCRKVPAVFVIASDGAVKG